MTACLMKTSLADLEVVEKPQAVKFSVAFILLHEFSLFAFSGFVDAMRLAGDEIDKSRQKNLRWTVIAPDMTPIKSSSGVSINPWQTFSDASDFDYLVVVGGRVDPQRKANQKIVDYINKVSEQGKMIISICTATFMLARAGLMNGRRCCVHWVHKTEFEEEFPDLNLNSDVIFLEDNNRITCAAGRSSADVAFHLIKKHCGEGRARKAATGMMISEIRDGQSPQPHFEADWFSLIKNIRVRRAITMMDRFISRRLTMKKLAAHLRVSEKVLHQEFIEEFSISPARFFRLMRLAHGHWSLKNTDMSISQISHQFQFSDASHFTMMHRQYYGVTPGKIRGSGGKIWDQKRLTSNRKIEEKILNGSLFIFS